MSDTHGHGNMEALALRLILAQLEKNDHGTHMAVRDLYITGCEDCHYALIAALTFHAANAFELIDPDEVEARGHDGYRLDPARRERAAPRG